MITIIVCSLDGKLTSNFPRLDFKQNVYTFFITFPILSLEMTTYF